MFSIPKLIAVYYNIIIMINSINTCNILNDRLSTWSEANNTIVDEQNGFRKKRSTNDHISSLVNQIET